MIADFCDYEPKAIKIFQR